MAGDKKKAGAGSKPQKSDAAATDSGTPAAEPSKPAGGEAGSDKSANYSRGEGQKPVSQAYRSNWNDIFGKKTKKR